METAELWQPVWVLLFQTWSILKLHEKRGAYQHEPHAWNMRISPTFWACFPPKWMSKQQHVGFYTGMTQVKLQNKGVGAGFQASCIHWKPWSNISLLSLPVGRFLFFSLLSLPEWSSPGGFCTAIQDSHFGKTMNHILPWYGSMGPWAHMVNHSGMSHVYV